jgi:hypothetical protein
MNSGPREDERTTVLESSPSFSIWLTEQKRANKPIGGSCLRARQETNANEHTAPIHLKSVHLRSDLKALRPNQRLREREFNLNSPGFICAVFKGKDFGEFVFADFASEGYRHGFNEDDLAWTLVAG